MRRCLDLHLHSSSQGIPRPKFGLNESLTSHRRRIFATMRAVREKHRAEFQQLYTNDGTITIKLKSKPRTKYQITDTKSLEEFLKNHPAIGDTYRQEVSC